MERFGREFSGAGFENFSAEENLEARQEQERQPKIFVNNYEVEPGQMVELKARVTNPDKGVEGKEQNPRDVVVFLPGYTSQADYTALEPINQSFANESKQDTYTITTRQEQSGQKETQQQQARAIAKYLKELGLEEITLIGQSNGGDKAMRLAEILQEEYPEIKMRALALVNSVGLYEQDSENLRKNFHQTAKQTQLSKNTVWAGIEIAYSVIKEAIRSRGWKEYIKRTRHDAKHMASKNSSAEKITAPVFLVHSEDDLVSDHLWFTPPLDKKVSGREEIHSYNESRIKESIFPNAEAFHYKLIRDAEQQMHHGTLEERNTDISKLIFSLRQEHESKLA